MISNLELLKKTRISISSVWHKAAFATFIYCLIFILLGLLKPKELYTLLNLLIAGPLGVGIAKISLGIYRENKFNPWLIFEGFVPKRWLVALIAETVGLIVVLLGFVLCIVPGIVMALGFSQVLFLIADDKVKGPIDALKKSYALMKGHKKQYFYFVMRIALYSLLCILTLGIGYLWYFPFYNLAYVVFYEDIVIKVRA